MILNFYKRKKKVIHVGWVYWNRRRRNVASLSKREFPFGIGYFSRNIWGGFGVFCWQITIGEGNHVRASKLRRNNDSNAVFFFGGGVFIVARAIFQLSGGWAANLDLCLALMAFNSEGSFNYHICVLFLIDWLIDYLFIVLRPAQEYLIYIETNETGNTEVPCHSRCGTIKIPPCSKALRNFWVCHWQHL
jgi:hypothetical protein